MKYIGSETSSASVPSVRPVTVAVAAHRTQNDMKASILVIRPEGIGLVLVRGTSRSIEASTISLWRCQYICIYMVEISFFTAVGLT